jgi:hypothetical protein
MIRSLVSVMHNELETYESEPSDQSLTTLKQGVALLHDAFLRDPLFTQHHKAVKHQYVALVCGLEALYRRLGLDTQFSKSSLCY